MKHRYVSGPAVQPGAPRVLLVDEDEEWLERWSSKLVRLGCLCIEVTDGESAVKTALESLVDLIVVDANLSSPAVSEVVRALQGLKPSPSLIVCSDDPLDEARRAELLLGATRFVTKTHPGQMIAAAARLLGLKLPN
jgi:CheY-like chemotaxis protein